MAGKSPGPFPNCDWRFNEFPNPAAHALHVTCVELMALAVPGKDVGNALLNVVLKRYVGSLKQNWELLRWSLILVFLGFYEVFNSA